MQGCTIQVVIGAEGAKGDEIAVRLLATKGDENVGIQLAVEILPSRVLKVHSEQGEQETGQRRAGLKRLLCAADCAEDLEFEALAEWRRGGGGAAAGWLHPGDAFVLCSDFMFIQFRVLRVVGWQ
ncbi:hypothetical protein FGB62_7g38 [Gracilaria domingensis]|nr:hypothetical protein FGB62_7g38 [Gracilaria domingensis]